LLGIWSAVVVLVVVPWGSFQDHSHWARVQWIPFVTPPVKLRDIVANTLIYVPIGYAVVRIGQVSRVWKALVFAFVLSLATEFSQVYSHGRFPSITDLTCNVCGACLGALRRRSSQSGVTDATDTFPGHPGVHLL
jgi:glycopeptide antibiotics resistance protein